MSTLINSLVSFWPLDEASGSRRDAYSTNELTDNATVTSAVGPFGRNALFTRASSEFLSVAETAGLSGGDKDFTVAGWVKLTSDPNADMCMAAQWVATANQRAYEILWVDATALFAFRVSQTGAAETARATASTFGATSIATWYFLEAYHDATGNVVSINVNNGTANTAAHATGVFDSNAPFTLGARDAGSFLNGEMWGWGVWTRLLTAGERTFLYNGGAGRNWASIFPGARVIGSGYSQTLLPMGAY